MDINDSISLIVHMSIFHRGILRWCTVSETRVPSPLVHFLHVAVEWSSALSVCEEVRGNLRVQRGRPLRIQVCPE